LCLRNKKLAPNLRRGRRKQRAARPPQILMSSGGSGTSSGRGTCRSSGCDESESNRSVLLLDLLGLIHGYYKAALDRLPVEEMPALIPCLDAGVSFGLLDPVSNIIANTSCSIKPYAAQRKEVREAEAEAEVEEQEQEAEGDKSRRWRKRKGKASLEEVHMMNDEAMLEIITDADSIFYLPPNLRGARMRKKRTIAQRSLEGLVTFLVYYFRHLPVSEALHYLILAKADLLAAVLLIESIRGVGRSRLCPISSPTTETTLRFAAIAASLPEPATFAARSLSLASCLEPISQLPTIGGECLSPDAINQFHEML
jgi:hypothetical protein